MNSFSNELAMMIKEHPDAEVVIHFGDVSFLYFQDDERVELRPTHIHLDKMVVTDEDVVGLIKNTTYYWSQHHLGMVYRAMGALSSNNKVLNYQECWKRANCEVNNLSWRTVIVVSAEVYD